MNDLDFLGMVENIRSALLFLFNSSIFWIIIGFYSIVRMSKAIVSCETNSEKKKVWNYE